MELNLTHDENNKMFTLTLQPLLLQIVIKAFEKTLVTLRKNLRELKIWKKYNNGKKMELRKVWTEQLRSLLESIHIFRDPGLIYPCYVRVLEYCIQCRNDGSHIVLRVLWYIDKSLKFQGRELIVSERLALRAVAVWVTSKSWRGGSPLEMHTSTNWKVMMSEKNGSDRC